MSSKVIGAPAPDESTALVTAEAAAQLCGISLRTCADSKGREWSRNRFSLVGVLNGIAARNYWPGWRPAVPRASSGITSAKWNCAGGPNNGTSLQKAKSLD